MEEGGRREIAMLVPVVFLILPVTVMFALYPGLIALDFTPVTQKGTCHEETVPEERTPWGAR